MAQLAKKIVVQEEKAVYVEPKRAYKPKIKDRDFFEAEQQYKHLKKQIS